MSGDINPAPAIGVAAAYGLVLAAQRRRRSVEELIAKTPADGLVGGVGTVNGDLFDPAAFYCIQVYGAAWNQAPTQGNPMRGKPVFMANSAGEWLFDSV